MPGKVGREWQREDETVKPSPEDLPINIEQAYIGDPEQRPFTTTGERTIDVGNYAGVQDALDKEMPWFPRHCVTFNLEAKNYGEDVIVPVYWGGLEGSAGDALHIDGDPANPGNYTGLSFGIPHAGGYVRIYGVTIDRETPLQGENAGVLFYDCPHGAVSNCAFGSITNGVVSYSSGVMITEVDFGTGLTGDALITKHGGTIIEQSVGATNITGTADGYAYYAVNGIIFHYSGSNLSGSTGQAKSDQGFVFDETGKVLAGIDELQNLTLPYGGPLQWRDSAGTVQKIMDVGYEFGADDTLLLQDAGGNTIFWVVSGGAINFSGKEAVFRGPIRGRGTYSYIDTAGYGYAIQNFENLSGKTGNTNGEIRIDDGTNTTSGSPGLCIWDDANARWICVEDGSTFT